MGRRTANWIAPVRPVVTVLPGVVNVSARDGLCETAEAATRIRRDPKKATLYLKRGEPCRLRRGSERAAADYGRAVPRSISRGRMRFEAGSTRRVITRISKRLRPPNGRP